MKTLSDETGSFTIFSSAKACAIISLHILGGIKESDKEKPTPCPGMNVAQLIAHQYGAICRVATGLGITPSGEIQASAEIQMADLLEKVLEEFAARGLAGSFPLGSNILPAEKIAQLLNVELLVHAIDLAVATQQEIEIPIPLAEYVLHLARQAITTEFRESGRYSKELELPPESGALQQLLAFTGRAG